MPDAVVVLSSGSTSLKFGAYTVDKTKLTAMEPSHQAYNVLGARALAEAFPGLPQVACFDSSFHRTMPNVAQIYGLPQDARDAGAHHWGYHGISYDYISRQLPKYAPDARRVIAAHLG